jgi:hypothetical protein
MYSLALILIIAWLLGIVSSYTLGGFIHLFLVAGLLLLLIPFFLRNESDEKQKPH